MEPEAPTGAIRRGFRRWTWLVPAVLILPLLLFFLSNLWLATPWSCRWIAGKIERQTGLETRVGGATWSPWSGIAVQSVDLLQPAAIRAAIQQPLAHIDSIRLAPVWRAWLRGRLEVTSVSLDSPNLTIPLELLSYLSANSPKNPPAPANIPPPVAQATPPTTAQPPAAVSPPPFVGPPKPVPTAPTPPPQPTGWLNLKSASIHLVSIGKKSSLLEVANISGALPIGGDPAQSEVSIAAISINGQRIFSNLSAPVEWKNPVLSLKPTELEIGGCKILVASKVAALSGLPIQIEAKIPKQPLAKLKLPFNGIIDAQSIAANAGFRGLLSAPSTWQGDLITEILTATVQISGHTANFDRGGSVTVLRGGLLSCVDARLISDEFSVLGNATVIANGRAAAALRIVAPPANLDSIVKQVFPNIGPPSITPLSTPQRSAFDLEISGAIGQLLLRPGREGPIIHLNP